MLDLIYIARFDHRVRCAQRNQDSKHASSGRAADGAAAIALAKRRLREKAAMVTKGGR